MRITNILRTIVLSSLFAGAISAPAQLEPGFNSLFDGKTLDGWKLMAKKGDGYGVKDGVIYCARGGGGNLLTEKEYANFILRLDFKLEPSSNNGVGIRCPMEGASLAYSGTEIQILDDAHEKYVKMGLKPWQFHGSVYGVVPAKHGALKPIGEWNQYEIIADGRHIKVTCNDKVIVDTDLNQVTDAETLRKHPGMLRESGHIGFLGHNDYVEFRNIRIKELPANDKDNTPPEGFTALFNGKDLAGWKGLMARPNDNPFKRAALSPEERAAAQAKADEDAHAHWKAEDGAIVFDGKGRSLCTAKDYADFEMLVDWKIKEQGDTGIYLRGSPQVQIWDAFNRGERTTVGSGGLFNNKTNRSTPLVRADKPIGEWNRLRILMVGEKVHVFLNGQLVVNDITMENYWDYKQPIFPSGQIELQNHGNTLWFKNIYIREIAHQAEK